MQIVIVTRPQRIAQRELLTAAFALRHRVFVGVRGWEELSSEDGLDRDRHDDEDAIHILLTEESIVRGHIRIIPGGYLHAAMADPDKARRLNLSQGVSGLSRFCYDPTVPIIDQRAGLARLFGATMEHAIKTKIPRFIFDTDPLVILFLRVLGFSVETIGESVRHHGRLMQPVVLNVDQAVLPKLAARLTAWEREGYIGAPPFVTQAPKTT